MKKILVAAVAVIMALSMAACGKGNEVQVPVQSVAEIVGLGPLGMAQRFAGVVSVQDPVKIMKNGETKIGEIMVEEGDDVREGDVLFVYDTDQLTLDLEKAKLESEKMWNDMTNMQEEKAQLEAEKAKAPADQQLQYSLEINTKDTELLEAYYNFQVKQKEIETLEKSLENATVKAEVSGRIGTITDGQQTDNMGQPLPLMTIVQTNDLLVKGSINENNIYALSPGMDVIVRSRVDEKIWKGTLSRIDTDNPIQNQDTYYVMTDSGDGTGTSSKYPFYVELEDTEGLMLGQHVYVEPGSADEDPTSSWRLPAWYIVNIDSDPYVWAQDRNGKLEKRHVTLGEADTMNMDMDSFVITEGLTPEDKIAFPDDNLTEGAVCVDYREYVPPAEETEGGEVMPGEDMPAEEMPAGEIPVMDDAAEMPVMEEGAAEEYVTDMEGVNGEMAPEAQEGETVTGAWETPEYPEETTGGDN